MATDNRTETPRGPTAPYISFQTLKTISKDMGEHSVPSRIDRSVFPTLSGGVVSQLLPALKFLRLTDDNGYPTPDMHALVGAVGTDDWPSVLGKIIRAAYAPIFGMNLENASPRQFDEVFRATYPGTEDVGRKSKTFFISAAQDAGIKISPYITKGRKTRAAPTKRRVMKQNGTSGRSDALDNDLPPPPPLLSNKLPSEVLLGYFDPEMGDDEQNAVWTLLKYFKSKGR